MSEQAYVRVNIYMPVELKEKLESRAKLDHRSISAQGVIILENYFRQRQAM